MKLRRTMTTLGLAGTLFGSALGVGGSADAAASTSPQAAASVSPQAAPLVWATLYITSVGNGYYLVVVDGHSTAANTPVGIRVLRRRRVVRRLSVRCRWLQPERRVRQLQRVGNCPRQRAERGLGSGRGLRDRRRGLRHPEQHDLPLVLS